MEEVFRQEMNKALEKSYQMADTNQPLIKIEDFMPDIGEMIEPYKPYLIGLTVIFVVAWLAAFVSKLRMQKAVVDLRKEVKQINLKLDQLARVDEVSSVSNQRPTNSQPANRDNYVAKS